MELKEKAAYLKGLVEGLGIPAEPLFRSAYLRSEASI